MTRFHSTTGQLLALMLCLLVGAACENETLTTPATVRQLSRPLDRSTAEVSSLVRSWELADTTASDHSRHHPATTPLPRAVSTVNGGDPCNGLDITLIIHDFGSTLEAEIHFTNSNDGPWSGELNLDFARHDEPTIRHGVVQNVETTIQPGGWQSLYVLMVRPEIPACTTFGRSESVARPRSCFASMTGRPS